MPPILTICGRRLLSQFDFDEPRDDLLADKMLLTRVDAQARKDPELRASARHGLLRVYVQAVADCERARVLQDARKIVRATER